MDGTAAVNVDSLMFDALKDVLVDINRLIDKQQDTLQQYIVDTNVNVAPGVHNNIPNNSQQYQTSKPQQQAFCDPQKLAELIQRMSNDSARTHGDVAQYCGPYKIEKTLGKGQTGMYFHFFL